jgi:quinol monooxygenase YgiN
MAIVRMIHVHVPEDQRAETEKVWRQECAPLMAKQHGCLSETLLRCIENPGNYISYQEWEDEAAIERYRESAAHAVIQETSRGLQGARAVIKTYEVVD